MAGEGFHVHMLFPAAVLVAVVLVTVVLARWFARPQDVSTLGAAAGDGGVADLQCAPADATARDGFVVIPDISGYTRFMRLNRFAAGHAQYVVAQLLDAVITAARPVLAPTRVEGDSVMFHADSERDAPGRGASGAGVADAVGRIVEAFYERRSRLAGGNLCPCEACRHIRELELKVVVHRGEIVRYRLQGLEDLSGLVVIEAHRLLKNSLGLARYVLVSEAAAADVELPWPRREARHREVYDGIGEMRCELYSLEELPGAAAATAPSPLRDTAGKLGSNLKSLTGEAR